MITRAVEAALPEGMVSTDRTMDAINKGCVGESEQSSPPCTADECGTRFSNKRRCLPIRSNPGSRASRYLRFMYHRALSRKVPMLSCKLTFHRVVFEFLERERSSKPLSHAHVCWQRKENVQMKNIHPPCCCCRDAAAVLLPCCCLILCELLLCFCLCFFTLHRICELGVDRSVDRA